MVGNIITTINEAIEKSLQEVIREVLNVDDVLSVEDLISSQKAELSRITSDKKEIYKIKNLENDTTKEVVVKFNDKTLRVTITIQ